MQTKVQPIDSKQKLLSGPNLLAEYFAKASEVTKMSRGSAALAMQRTTLEMAAPNSNYIQIGNTAFVTMMGTKKGKGKGVTKIYNVDTPFNLMANILKYNNYMVDKNVTEAIFPFRSFTVVAKLVAMAAKTIEKMGGGMVLTKGKKSGQVSVLIKPTKKKIPSEYITKMVSGVEDRLASTKNDGGVI